MTHKGKTNAWGYTARQRKALAEAYLLFPADYIATAQSMNKVQDSMKEASKILAAVGLSELASRVSVAADWTRFRRERATIASNAVARELARASS